MRAGGLSHCASAECAVPASAAFRFLADGAALGRWALGCFGAREVSPGLWRGTSLFDGTSSFVRPIGDPERLRVDYWIGTSRRSLSPRIVALAVPGERLGRSKNRSLVTLLAWRDARMTEDRWERLVACHEVEVRLIQALLARRDR
ncbi:MAG: hypothetical protein N2653_10255 [Burkholderiales bacterium]|nr:hypothetical protein [Burkholderiales bacterium]